MKLKTGLLIVFEGIDGTGKSTQINLLAEHLISLGFSVINTREPTNGVYGKKIRSLYTNRKAISLNEELELFINDRKEHIKNVINPAINDGKIVLCDRYFLSNIAYQGASGLDPEYIFDKNSFAPAPDLVIMLSSTPELSVERITAGRGDKLNDFEQESFLADVAEIFEQMTQDYIYRIDAKNSIKHIHEKIVKKVNTLTNKAK